MTTPRYHIAAIGNALVDVIADASDSFLAAQGIAKGGMTLIDETRATSLYAAIGPALETSGGSAANTVAGVGSFGGRAAFMGKVKADQLGSIFRHDLTAQGVTFATPPALESTSAATGRCIILVTPDAQRSMSTFLGAAVEFSAADIDATTIKDAAVTYLEGYLFDPPEAKAAFRAAANVAREAKRQLSLTLSDTFCVERHRADFTDLVKNAVDVLFANENELKALYQTADIHAAIEAARHDNKIIVTTRSEKGAVITRGKETAEIPAAPVAQVVDTTGAGDLFAAGFLFGITDGKNLAEAGRLGALAAAEVISHYGPRPRKKLKELL